MKLSTFFNFALVMVLLLFCTISSAQAQTFPNPPKDGEYIVDLANLINLQTYDEINQAAAKLLKDTGVPVFVVTIDSMANFDAASMGIESYATAMYNSWGIGDKELNYGALLLVSNGDRKARIELGKGFDHRYDAEAMEIMQNFIIPNFRQGDFSGGIRNGVAGLDRVFRGLDLPKPKTAPVWLIGLVILIFGGAAIGIVVSLFKSGKSGWGWVVLAALGMFIWMFIRAMASGKGGSGRSGGFWWRRRSYGFMVIIYVLNRHSRGGGNP